MKTGTVVSCPHCGKEIVLSMELKAEKDGFEYLIGHFLNQEKHYSFIGDTKCDCGKNINGIFTVSGWEGK